jgi:hypothetical protein
VTRLVTAANAPWLFLGVVALITAGHTLIDWVTVVASGVSTGYGEGAVAHAGQIVARGGDPYAAEAAGTFVSANYPPLAYVIEALGTSLGPFTALRIANIVALCAVAALVASRARSSPLVAAALGLSFLALFPVAAWGSGARVDPLAVAFTAFAVVTASPDPRRAALAGLFAALAIAAKPRRSRSRRSPCWWSSSLGSTRPGFGSISLSTTRSRTTCATRSCSWSSVSC